jgi:hypothetical protein
MYLADEGRKFPQNVGFLVPDFKMSHSQKAVIIISTTLRVLNLTGEFHSAKLSLCDSVQRKWKGFSMQSQYLH